jgi:hypothetical protein
MSRALAKQVNNLRLNWISGIKRLHLTTWFTGMDLRYLLTSGFLTFWTYLSLDGYQDCFYNAKLMSFSIELKNTLLSESK